MRHELNIDNLIDRDGVWGSLTYDDDDMPTTDAVQRCIELLGEGWKEYQGWEDNRVQVAAHAVSTLDDAIRMLQHYRKALEAIVVPHLLIEDATENLAAKLLQRPLTREDLTSALVRIDAANKQRGTFGEREDFAHSLITAAFAPPTKDNA